MRIRTIKPEWLSSQKLAGASDAARVLSVALILMSDDHGRGRGSIAEIAMQTWRYDMTREDGAKARETLAKVRETLAELSATGFVRLYQVEGDDFFELPGWTSHQRVDKPGKSKIPQPCEDTKNPRETLAKVPGTLATDQGSGIRDQGPGEGTSTGDPERQATAEEWTKPKGLLALADVVRSEVVAVFEERRLEPPRETRALTHGAWTDIARFVVGTRKRRGLQAEPAAMARDLVRAYYASTDPRTVKAGHPISFLAARPEQYIPEGA